MELQHYETTGATFYFSCNYVRFPLPFANMISNYHVTPSSAQTTLCPTCSRLLYPAFSGSDKFLQKFCAFRMSVHFKYKFPSKYVLLFFHFFLQKTKISLVATGRAGRIVFRSRKQRRYVQTSCGIHLTFQPEGTVGCFAGVKPVCP